LRAEPYLQSVYICVTEGSSSAPTLEESSRTTDRPVLRQLTRIAILGALAATIALLAPGRAAAAPCWKQIVNDWSADGKIDKTYPVHCYREALANLPEDVRDYTSLGDDIQTALQATLVGKHRGGGGPFRGLQGHDASSLAPSNADSLPLPLLVLAGLAALLLAAGTAGGVARKLESRRVPAVRRS
jgi:hypothetical protein